jgi:hypothetical protein
MDDDYVDLADADNNLLEDGEPEEETMEETMNLSMEEGVYADMEDVFYRGDSDDGEDDGDGTAPRLEDGGHDVDGEEGAGQEDEEHGEGGEVQESGKRKLAPVWASNAAKKVDKRAQCNMCNQLYSCDDGNTSVITPT